MTGQLSQLRARAEDAGAPTGEFAVVAFPVLRERWKRLERWVKAAAPARSLDQASTPGSARRGSWTFRPPAGTGCRRTTT